jgi:hypothetical protein
MQDKWWKERAGAWFYSLSINKKLSTSSETMPTALKRTDSTLFAYLFHSNCWIIFDHHLNGLKF